MQMNLDTCLKHCKWIRVKESQADEFRGKSLDVESIKIINKDDGPFRLESILDICNSANVDSTLSALSAEIESSLGAICALNINKLFSNAHSFSRQHLCKGDYVDNFTETNLLSASEKQNLAFHKNNFSPWLEVYHHKKFLLVAEQDSEIFGIEALGTVLVSERVGSLMAYPFILNRLLVAPVYSTINTQLVALVVCESTSGQSAVVNHKDLPFARTTTVMHDIENIISGINILVSEVVEEANCTKESSRRNSYHIVVGQRLNYGHNIINDSYCLSIIKDALANGSSCNILLGNFDFFSTLQIVDDYSTLLNAKNCLSFDLLRRYHKKKNIYVLPRKIAYTVPTNLPLQSSLNLLRASYRSKNSHSECIARAGKAFYIAGDNRGGGRSWRNFCESLVATIKTAKDADVECIVLDGLTFCPIYDFDGDLIVATNTPASIFSEEIIHGAAQIASTLGLRFLCIDGLTMLEKSRLLSDLEIVKAVAPYGGGAAFPVYVLNARTALVGSEWVGSSLPKWHWWLARYCHSQRVEDTLYVTSVSHGINGYIVDPDSLLRFLLD